jgi:anti-anti-sigma factor
VILVRRASSRASRPTLTLVSVDGTPRESVSGNSGEVAGRCQPAPSGELVVRRERRTDALILWLTGTLDRATSELLARELDAQANSSTHLVVDLTGLEFIDSTGVHTLTRARRRARASGRRLSIEANNELSPIGADDNDNPAPAA